MNIKQFIYGDYKYEYVLVWQERKTLSLTVCPDMSLVVKCPHEVGEEKIEAFLRRKWSWLNKQLQFFGKFRKSIYEKEYISGESFLYLGRQYKLVVKKGSENKVVLLKGKLFVITGGGVRDGERNRQLVEEWYKEKMQGVFTERYESVLREFNYDNAPNLVIKKMNKRWGSFTNVGNLVLNSKLIHASKDCIDYVIAHELCHVKHKNHDKDFYKLLSKKMPSWEKTKEKLELRLG